MKRSKQITLLCLTTIIAGFVAGCSDQKPNNLRQKRTADGALAYDKDGNPIWEDDQRQQYSYHGGMFFPWYTRANGYATIPGSGVAAPESNAGMTKDSIVRTASRGGFGSSGHSHSSSGAS